MEPCPTYPLKRIVILGASGQIGRLLCRHLSEHFPQATVMASVRKAETNADSAYQHILFDPFADKWQKLGKVDVLINCIGIIKETAQVTFEKAHEGITQRILENRRLIGNPRIIQISALGADKNSSIRFLRTKGKADKLLLAHENTIVLRPSIVCTPDTMMVQKLHLLAKVSRFLFNYLPFPATLLQTRIQPILPADLADIISRLCFLEKLPRLVYAVGPSPFSVEQLIRLSSGHRIRFIKLSKKLSDAAARIISYLFPELLSKEQYKLLQTDNTHPTGEVENILKRNLQPTKNFWQQCTK